MACAKPAAKKIGKQTVTSEVMPINSRNVLCKGVAVASGRFLPLRRARPLPAQIKDCSGCLPRQADDARDPVAAACWPVGDCEWMCTKVVLVRVLCMRGVFTLYSVKIAVS